MGKILNAEEGNHIVKEYSFLSLDFSKDKEQESVSISSNENIQNDRNTTNNHNSQQNNNTQTVNNTAQIELMEKLLSKSDEFSGSIVKLEQQLTLQAKDCNDKIGAIKESSYKAGYNEGYNEAKKELEDKIKEHLSKLIESVHKIEEVYKEYQHKAENIEKELVGVAVDIAEEVVAKELTKSSKEIALNLTKELINDIKEATKIEVKVNPLDYDYVKENIKLDKVEIIPDNAISLGGVVILSDAGNIEAEINERFKAIKSHVLKG